MYYSRVRFGGGAARNISTASFLLPLFGTRLRRQNFNLAPTQYRQLRRLLISPFLPATFFQPAITRSKSPELELFSFSLEGSSYRESTKILLPAHSLFLFSSSPSRASRLSPVITLRPFSFIRLPGSSH